MSARVHFVREGRVLIVQWPTYVTMEDVETYCNAVTERLRTKEPFAIVQLALHTIEFPAKERAAGAEYERRQKAALGAYLKGMAVVVSNPFIIGIATALNWMAPPPFPKKMFMTLSAAKGWASSLFVAQFPDRDASR